MSDAKQTTKQPAKPAAKQAKTTTTKTTKDQPVTQTKGTAENPDAVVRNFRKTRVGLVVSDKMDKTVVVAVEDRVQHALYGKILRRTNKLKAHDENNDAGIGDRVLIMETRPQSATKRWRLVEIVERAR